MVSVEEALEKILSRIKPLGAEKVHLLESLGRIIAEDIYSLRDVPPVDNSAMDGYAVRSEDVRNASPRSPVTLQVVGDLPAGFVSTRTLQKGEAIRILTGAPIPEGADAVIMEEDIHREGRSIAISKRVEAGENIRKAGEDVKKGDLVISKGHLIRPADVGMLSSLGRASILVYQRAVVAILCTGEELVDVDEPLGEAKIVSSNSYSLSAQVKECGAIPIQLGIARDRKDEIREKLSQGLRADVLISSAGISGGDYDLVRDALKDLGMEMVFWKVAMKPGKPVAFGTIDGKPVFGLPGNPVSSMVSFEQFVRPAILKMMGHEKLFRPTVEAILEEDIRKEPGRRHYIRARIRYDGERFFVTTTGDQGPGVLRSMVMTNGLVVIPEDCEFVAKGERVKVQVIDRII